MIYAGIALGVGMLAKYAAIYGLFGFMLIWASGRHHPNPIIQGRHLLLVIAACLITVSPNLIWNLMHDFSTMRHLGDNANLAKQTHDIGQSLIFLIGQAGVAGPLVFFLMLGIMLASRREKHAGWLVWMAVPVIGLISLQAYLSEANANWAMAAYPALSVWLGGWLGSDGAQTTLLRLPRKWLGVAAVRSEFHPDHRPVAGHNGGQPWPLNTNIRSASSLTRLAGIGTGYRTASCRPSGKPHHR
jgi:4-amino-4-deoxy-L-arabinose transferase-like glycosyltransferase